MQSSSPTRQDIIRFGVFEADLHTGELRKSGAKIRLQEQPFQILLMLLQRPSEVVTREELQRKLWPADTFVDFEHGVNSAVARLREALGDSAESPRYVETLPRRGYRFIAPVEEFRTANAVADATGSKDRVFERLDSGGVITVNRRWVAIVGTAVVITALAIGGWLFYRRRAHALMQKDTMVLADFTNTTGDGVFDGTLRQGLSVQLEQSPFLSLISDQVIQQTLHLMGEPPDAKLTPEIARNICQRTESAAILDGSIASLGNQYILGIKAVNCRTGDTLAEEQVRATGKEHVLGAMDTAAAKLRERLGESLSTVKKFDAPIVQATTPSLEALQAYSLGRAMVGKADWPAAVPFFQRAIRLDPNFAIAHSALGVMYSNLGETSLASDSTKTAYELRDRVSERERFLIESSFHYNVTGDLEKARQTYEVWAQIYPRDDVPPSNLGSIYRYLGQHDRALAEKYEAFRLNPDALSYANLVRYYVAVNRLAEAQAAAEEAFTKKLDSPLLRLFLYQLALLQNDAAGMALQVAWAKGKPGIENVLLANQADTAAYFGRLGEARELSRRAVASARRAGENETAGTYEADAALREALFGYAVAARQRAAAAMSLSTNRDVQYGAALALALAVDAARAQTLADDLAKRFPEDTLVQFNYLPTIRAQLSLGPDGSVHSSGTGASRAIDALQAAAPNELGRLPASSFDFVSLYPVYVRGEAYLAAHQGSKAAAEFQKILDHRGVVVNGVIGAIAHFGLARANVLQGDAPKARAAYSDSFALWKDADPALPVLNETKAEYEKLK